MATNTAVASAVVTAVAASTPGRLTFQTTAKNAGAYNYRKHAWDLSGQLDLQEYIKKSPWVWELGGEVRGDDEVKAGYRIVPLGEWGTKPFVVYLMVINGKIIKGGKVKGPIQTRSYSAGTEENWTMGTSDPSSTNYVFSQIFRMCVANNIPVQFWCHACETNTVTWTDAYGNEQITHSSAYEEIESSLNQHLRETLGRHPIGDGGLLELKKA